MLRCTRCEGFVPAELSFCPNCSKSGRKGASKSGFLAVLGAGAAAITLMACYGAPPCDVPGGSCYTPPDAGMTTDGGVDAGTTDAGKTDAGTCDGGSTDGGC